MIHLLKFVLFFGSALFFSYDLSSQVKKKAEKHGPGEDIYKHYTGTIGNRKAVLDLVYGYQGASNYGGSFYYYIDSPATRRFVIIQPKSFDHNVTLHAEVDKDAATLEETRADHSGITWDFKIGDNILTGQLKEDGQTQEIKLTEDYSKSTAFDFESFTNDTIIKKNEPLQAKAEIYILGLKAAVNTNGSDADFIHREILKFLEQGKTSYKNISTGYLSYNEAWLKKSVDKLKAGIADNLDGKKSLGLRKSVLLRPVYNDHKFLMIRKIVYASDEDASTFLCLDIRNKKKLDLNDILNIDNTKLQTLLELELRKKYQLAADKKLNTWLIVDEVKVTTNFFMTHKGISFYYNSGELHENEIVLHLGYEQLRSMLKKDVAARIKD